MGIRVFLPHTLSRWHEYGFDPKHPETCAGTWLESCPCRWSEKSKCVSTFLVAYDQVMCSSTTAAQGWNQEKQGFAAYGTLISTLSWGMLLMKWQWALSWMFAPALTHFEGHVYIYFFNKLENWELVKPCALGAWRRNHKVIRGTFLQSPCP
jgi:hypothetical protein